MDGRNCNGRKISLLNDSSNVAAFSTKIQLPPLTAHYSRAPSSCESTPSSPQTPQLIRSNSSDSRGFPTPSPLTPSYNVFENQTQNSSQKPQDQNYYIANHTHNKMDDVTASMYPPIPDATVLMPSAYPIPQIPQQIPPQLSQPTQRLSNSPSSEPSRLSTVSATSNPKSQPKKNQYPCPMAKQVGCTDFFTTSGHAARHAKKHTGKKDAYCPDCNKAFTRKDNMEQHRRTHQNGRGSRTSANSSNGDDAKVKKPSKPSAKKATAKIEPQQLESAIEEMVTNQPVPIIPAAIPPQVIQPDQAQILQQMAMEQALMNQPNGPYFLGGGIDTGPVPPLPMAVPAVDLRPQLHRSSMANSLEFIPPTAPMGMIGDPDLHYSYPSPGLSNGLNSLALAASEHRRLSEEKAQSRSPLETPSQETPSESRTP